jgi:hypothetical protein
MLTGHILSLALRIQKEIPELHEKFLNFKNTVTAKFDVSA